MSKVAHLCVVLALAGGLSIAPSPAAQAAPAKAPAAAIALATPAAALPTVTTSRMDRRCRTGRVICIDKTRRTVRWVVNGTVKTTMDARFGARRTPTREGTFTVYWKSRYHVSSLYGSSMPFAMFFSGGQAVHYSADFAARGYAGASHGCVNVRNWSKISYLYGQVRVGDKVVVYRS